MAMQQVEYEFPDGDPKSTAITVDVEEKEDNSLEVEGAIGRESMKAPKKVEQETFEVEIEDDTPVEDRGRKPSKPPEAVTDEELENYSEKVKSRIKHFSKGYHDERRAKETAMRQSGELETYARSLMAENDKLKGTVNHNHNSLIESAKKQVQGEMALAERQYTEAYESGESDKVLAAQTALNAAQIRLEKVNALKPKQAQSLQAPQTPVQTQVDTPKPQAPQPDERASSWREENTWFGEDDEMTAFALGFHNKLTKGGEDPRSDAYYEKINARMREMFPDQFDDGIEDEPAERKRKSSNVVAPATRSTSPKKVTLNQSQVAIAKRLGISLEDYAKQAAELMRNR